LTIYEFGEAEDARFIVSELIEGKTLREIIRVRSRSDSVRATRVNLAVLYVSLGMRDEAFALLEKAYAERYEHLGYIRGYPEFDALRDDPRFQDLMRRMGLAQ